MLKEEISGLDTSRFCRVLAFRPFRCAAMPPKKTVAQLGRVEGEGISFLAHFRYRDEQDKRDMHIRGPTRTSRRRAERDLLSIRKASEGHSVWAEAIAAMNAKSRELRQEAEFEANVAMGLLQAPSRSRGQPLYVYWSHETCI